MIKIMTKLLDVTVLENVFVFLKKLVVIAGYFHPLTLIKNRVYK